MIGTDRIPARTVVVTGASRGIGLATATLLAAEGYRVVAIARRTSEELETAIDAAGGALRFVAADLSVSETFPDVVRRIRAEHGAIYGLVNNAALGTPGLLATMPASDVVRLVHLNTVVPILLTKQVVRGMMTARAGRIVNISSVVALTGYNALSVYAATKAAMIGFTRSLARELGPLDITVNAIAPGFMETALTSALGAEDRDRIARRSALRRLPLPRDVAEAVVYLMSDGARNVTGTLMTIDAGSTA